MRITHNILAMNSNRQTRMIGRTLSKSSEKLSSGYRINKAADDAAGLSISEKMRRQIRGLTQGVLNAEDGVSLCQVADGALSQVHEMLQRLNELAVKAANGTNSVNDRKCINDEVTQILTEIDRIGDTTKFNEVYIFKGTEQQTVEKWITSGGTGGIEGRPQLIPVPSFDQMDMNCELTSGPFNSSSPGYHLNLSAQSTKAETPYVWNLIYGSGGTSFPKLTGEYTAAGTTSLCAFTMNFRDITPTSYTANVIQGENVWSRTFKYKNTANGLDMELIQKVTLHDKKGNESQYYTISYEVRNKGTVDVKYNLVHHEDTAYNNNDRVESYHLEGKGKVEYSTMYTTNTSYSSTINNVHVEDSIPGSFSIVNEQGALSFTESIVLDGGDGAGKADTLIVGNYYSVGELGAYTTTTMAGVLGDTTRNMDIGFSLVWSDRKLSANSSQKFSFKQGIVNVDKDKNIPSDIIKAPSININDTGEQPILVKKNILGGTRQLWIQSGGDAGDGLILKTVAMNTGVLDIDDISVLSEWYAEEAIKRVSRAIERLSAQRSQIGAYQNRLEHTIANEENIVENTTAAESRIRDTDMAKEMVLFSNKSILLQAGHAMLVQSNQLNNGVLSLLR